MRKLTLLVAVTAALLLTAPDAFAGDWSFEDYLQQKAKSDWSDFGVDSMIHMKTSQSVTMPGAPEPQVSEMEEKTTLVEITDTEYVLKVENLRDGEWVTSEKREAKDKGLTSKVEDAGTGSLEVEGTTYECAKKKVTWTDKDGEVDDVATLWVHAEKGILQMEIQGNKKGMLTVTKIDASWKVGETTVEGRELSMTMQTPQGMALKGSAWMSMDVPENLVKNVLSGEQGPVKVSVQMELVAVTKK